MAYREGWTAHRAIVRDSGGTHATKQDVARCRHATRTEPAAGNNELRTVDGTAGDSDDGRRFTKTGWGVYGVFMNHESIRTEVNASAS